MRYAILVRTVPRSRNFDFLLTWCGNYDFMVAGRNGLVIGSIVMIATIAVVVLGMKKVQTDSVRVAMMMMRHDSHSLCHNTQQQHRSDQPTFTHP